MSKISIIEQIPLESYIWSDGIAFYKTRIDSNLNGEHSSKIIYTKVISGEFTEITEKEFKEVKAMVNQLPEIDL